MLPSGVGNDSLSSFTGPGIKTENLSGTEVNSFHSRAGLAGASAAGAGVAAGGGASAGGTAAGGTAGAVVTAGGGVGWAFRSTVCRGTRIVSSMPTTDLSLSTTHRLWNTLSLI